MTGLLRCNCGEYVTENKDQVRMHERSKHAYGHVEWQKVKYVPLTKEQIAEKAVKGEKRLGLHYFFGLGPTVSTPKTEAAAPEIKYYHGPNETVK